MSTLLRERLRSAGESTAVIHGDRACRFDELDALADAYARQLEKALPPGAVVSFNGDYCPEAIALLLALIERQSIVVPLSSDSRAHFGEYGEIAQVEYQLHYAAATLRVEATGRRADHEHYRPLRDAGDAGLVLFSSGSTGKAKGIVQNLPRLIDKFRKPGHAQRMLIFLQLDHIGGINSLLYSLANGGTLVTPGSRDPHSVAAAIERHGVELLPTSPTFLNLLLLSGALQSHDLSSLRLITYGTEPMQASTLERIRAALPDIRLQQTYGLSEVGILRSRSRSSDSVWLQVGGDEFDVKISDGRLWIRSQSAMLGYLNAPSPFDEDGYLDTGDQVEVDGDWLRILGRETDIINVGGQKVYPAEVESVLLELEGIEDVVVFGEANPITGQNVVAKFKTQGEESPRALKARMRAHCRDRLPAFKVPARVLITQDNTFNERFKRMRRAD